jgi:hypothetical protein
VPDEAFIGIVSNGFRNAFRSDKIGFKNVVFAKRYVLIYTDKNILGVVAI